METCSHVADTTLGKFSTLDNDILRYDKLAKMVSKCTSVPFETCLLPLVYTTFFVWIVLFIGTESHINNINIRKHIYKFWNKNTFVNYLNEGEKHVIMTN